MGQYGSICALWLLMLLGHLGGAGGRRWRDNERQKPEFGETEKHIEVMVGKNARLPCIVLHLNDRAVTWLRRRDLHILTTGHHTYSADDRFQVVAGAEESSWPLLVRSAQPRDSGVYECQVNTDPKMSRPVTLTVKTETDSRMESRKAADSTVPLGVTKSKVFVANRTAVTRDGHLRVEIQGPSEVNIEEGSKLSLNCVVTSTLGAAAVVYWFHDSRLLDYRGPRGGVKLKIDQERGVTAARLEVENVGMDDAGMYSCVPAGSHPASIRVHVHTVGSDPIPAIVHVKPNTKAIKKPPYNRVELMTHPAVHTFCILSHTSSLPSCFSPSFLPCLPSQMPFLPPYPSFYLFLLSFSLPLLSSPYLTTSPKLLSTHFLCLP